MEKKQQPKRKLPKKSKRAKRRYILFSLKEGSCSNSKKAFALVMGLFTMPERKELGLWFIEFDPDSSKGIVRCSLKGISSVKRSLQNAPPKLGLKMLKTSGTLKALSGK